LHPSNKNRIRGKGIAEGREEEEKKKKKKE
jgi:hypothetical protein